MSRLILLLSLAGCGASQFVVHVDTDAPVPPRAGDAPDPMRPSFLFDVLRVEVMRGDQPAAMAGARRDFALDEGLFADGRISFGVAPPFGDSGLGLRLRMFRGDHALHGEPPVRATLETDVALPPLSSSGGPKDLAIVMKVDNVGVPQMENAHEGTIDHSLVESWPGAERKPCPSPAGDGEVCVRGGAFWMGDPLLRDIDPSLDVADEHLVVVSPFYLDTHEVTVADVRASTINQSPSFWSPSGDPNVYDSWCTYTRGPGSFDPDDSHGPLSVNCTTWDDAQKYCQRLGKDLPSEAEFEFAASGMGEERSFAWGGDEPTCQDAIWGWGGIGETYGYDGECRLSNDQIISARAPGSGLRDRALIDGKEVLDLAGNLSEWMRDDWSRSSEDYWSQPGVLYDPVGNIASAIDRGRLKTIRGGAFYDPPLLLRAAARDGASIANATVYYKIGWRCARASTPPPAP